MSDVLHLIAKPWKPQVILTLAARPLRYNRVLERVPAVQTAYGSAYRISDRMLTERLRELTDEGFVAREVDVDRGGVRIWYSLTPLGQRAAEILAELQAVEALEAVG